ncbi:hypothetical protein [Candidatus Nitrosotenuis uzonensis]|nr:hypothetical protein [Candidatus Nitrosotenuis uzonensis]
MKTIMVTSIAAILVFAVTVANVSPAEAKKADITDRLSPKSFGTKTMYKVSIEKSYDAQEPTMKLKSEQLKSKLKLMEAKKAKEITKKT